jgi:hypothetical protein
MMMQSKFASVEDDVGVDEGVAVSSNSLVSESFELPPLSLALEDFFDLKAGATDFDFVIRMIGPPNSVDSLERVVSFGLVIWTEEVEVR